MTIRVRLLPAAAVLLAATACRGSGDPAPRPTSTTRAPTTTSVPTTVAPTSTAPFDPSALRPPTPASAPAGLAAQIATAETTLRDASAGEPAVARAALAQQVAYRQLGVHPEWDSAVLAAVPAPLQADVARQAAARRQLTAIPITLKDRPPAWRIVAPEPLPALQADYEAAGAAFGIPWPYLAAVHLVETATGRIRGTSTAGAQGPMQFLPATWAAYGGGGDIDDTHDAIFGAARYLAANGGATDIHAALHRYNHSDHYVAGVVLYGDLIAEQPLALRAFYHWGVWYRTTGGELYLPVGYVG